MTTDPFAALTSAAVGWHYDGPGIAPTPEAIASARIVHALVSEWMTDSELIAAVGGGVLMDPAFGAHHLFIVIRPDGAVLVPDVTGSDRSFHPSDEALAANLRAWLGRHGGTE
jgi:hypothetical protein